MWNQNLEHSNSYRIDSGEWVAASIVREYSRGPGENVDYLSAIATVLSEISPRDKYTDGCADCIAVVARGLALQDGTPLSMLGHIDASFVHKDRKSLQRQLRESFRRLASMVEPDSAAVGIAAGMVRNQTDAFRVANLDFFNYPKMVRQVRRIALDELGVEARVLQGPKPEYLPINTSFVSILTAEGIATISEKRAERGDCIEPFLAKDINRKVDEWQGNNSTWSRFFSRVRRLRTLI